MQLFFQALKMSSKSDSQIYWGPQIFWPLLTLLHHCTSSISPPISSDHSVLCFVFFFPNFHFSLVFRKADRVPEKKSWLTERKGTGINVFRGSKNLTARPNQVGEAGYPNLLIYLLRCWGGVWGLPSELHISFRKRSNTTFHKVMNTYFSSNWNLQLSAVPLPSMGQRSDLGGYKQVCT